MVPANDMMYLTEYRSTRNRSRRIPGCGFILIGLGLYMSVAPGLGSRSKFYKERLTVDYGAARNYNATHVVSQPV